MSAFSFHSPNAEATRRLAAALARGIGDEGLVLALGGLLGAGKTTFVQGLAEGLGIAPGEVTSPTFALAVLHARPGGGWLAHLDFHRIERLDELESAGFFDLLQPDNLLAIEWAERFESALPTDRLEVRIGREPQASDPRRRVLHGRALGPAAAAVLSRWREAAGPESAAALGGEVPR